MITDVNAHGLQWVPEFQKPAAAGEAALTAGHDAREGAQGGAAWLQHPRHM
jgi:hypothetical protein